MENGVARIRSRFRVITLGDSSEVHGMTRRAILRKDNPN